MLVYWIHLLGPVQEQQCQVFVLLECWTAININLKNIHFVDYNQLLPLSV